MAGKGGAGIFLAVGLGLAFVALSGSSKGATPPAGGGGTPPKPPGGGGGGGSNLPNIPPGSLPPGVTPGMLSQCIDANMTPAQAQSLADQAIKFVQTGQLPPGVSSTTDWANQLEKQGFPKAAACARMLPAGNPGGTTGGGSPGVPPLGGLPEIPPGFPKPPSGWL